MRAGDPATIVRMLFSDIVAGPAATLVAELRDYPEWHRGRERYGVWVVPVVQPALLDYIAHVREQLADLLHPCPQRQPHLTVFVCGFHQLHRNADDDFSTAQLRRQLALLRDEHGLSCSLPLARPDSFAGAAFIPVGDPEGRLGRWRALLGQVCSEIRQVAYVPHITLGLYRQRVSAETVRDRLGVFEAPIVSLRVTELRYVTYAARNQFGTLRSHGQVPLRAARHNGELAKEASPCR